MRVALCIKNRESQVALWTMLLCFCDRPVQQGKQRSESTPTQGENATKATWPNAVIVASRISASVSGRKYNHDTSH